MNEVRMMVEKYCPHRRRNVPMEVIYSPSGERSEHCMQQSSCPDTKCQKREGS